MAMTPEALIGIVTFGHQLGYNNILSMYAVVLLLLPALLLISRYSLTAMVGVSGAIWLAAGLWRIGPPNFPNNGVWFLNPLSWQFLFVIGLAVMVHVRRGGSLPVNRWLVGAAGFYLALSLAWVKVPLWGIDVSMGLPSVLTGFDKTYLSLPRLAHVLSLAYLIVALPVLSNLARLSASNPLAVMGRHALPVFVVGTMLSMAAQAFRMTHEIGFFGDITIVVTGVIAQFALAYYIEWYRAIVRRASEASARAGAATATPAQRRLPPRIKQEAKSV